MIKNTNTATLTMCDFWRENTTRKHYQRCSACRGLFNKVKYIVSIIYSINIRNNIITWCKSAHSIFQMKKKPHAGSSMRRTNSWSSIVQLPDAFVKQLLTFHIKRKSNNTVWQFLYFKCISMHRKHKRMLVHVDASWCFRKPNIVNPLINQLDPNRPNAISTVSWVL